MTNTYKKLLFLISISIILFSCRQGENIIDEGSETSVIKTDSEVATIVKKIATKDGSADNILDQANCLTVKLPVNVIANGVNLTIEKHEDLEFVEDLFDESNSDTDVVEMMYPIQVIQKDYTVVTLNSKTELDTLRTTCNGENVEDEDIECVDFEYPIDISLFNTVSERSSRETIDDDEQLYSFITNLESSIVADFVYPVKLISRNGGEENINAAEELKRFIDTVGACDEDDDNDYSDDNCEDCDDETLREFLTRCDEWQTDKLLLNLIIIGIYTTYEFDFNSDGTLEVEGGSDHVGTWSATGSGNNTKLTINLPTLTDYNGEWTVYKINKRGNVQVLDLRKGNDRILFINTCD